MTEAADIAPLLNELFSGVRLSRERAAQAMGDLMDGRVSEIQAAALLAALRTRGETVEEITGFAEAMRQRAVAMPFETDGPLLDTCGTGGTGLSTLNISTTALFVATAGGVKVAKHGNRGVTKRSGSADLLEALGARIDLSPERLAQALDEVGVAFLFARAHHPAMKFVAPIRAELRARTVFNMLGPLTNPANADRQLMGVYDPSLTETIARVLAALGVRRALVVHGDGIDDFTVSGTSQVSELRSSGEVASYRVTPGGRRARALRSGRAGWWRPERQRRRHPRHPGWRAGGSQARDRPLQRRGGPLSRRSRRRSTRWRGPRHRTARQRRSTGEPRPLPGFHQGVALFVGYTGPHPLPDRAQ